MLQASGFLLFNRVPRALARTPRLRLCSPSARHAFPAGGGRTRQAERSGAEQASASGAKRNEQTSPRVAFQTKSGGGWI